MSSTLVSLLGSAFLLKTGPSTDFEKVKVGYYLREILILNSFTLEDKDPRCTRLKPFLALRLLSKGLFYIRAMVHANQKAKSWYLYFWKGQERFYKRRKGFKNARKVLKMQERF